MKKNILFWFFFLWGFVANAQAFLTENAKISLLTATPSDYAVYTLYGHTAIRIRDSIAADKTIDYVFNYGMFDNSQPNFVYKFAKGETDYMLVYYPYNVFVSERTLLNGDVYEQILNLTLPEMQDLWTALINNASPENRFYRYNYFFDNCATRPAQLIEQVVKGQIIYQANPAAGKTFRDIINDCTRDNAWLTFGCDLVLGIQTDRVVTLHESFFIPEYLYKIYSNAQIADPDGTKRPLVSEEYVLSEKIDDEKLSETFFTPLTCSLLLLAVVLFVTWIEWRRKKYFRSVDCLLFFMAGIAGCIIFFLCFLSEQPYTWPNITIGWLHPLHLIGFVLFSVKKLYKAAYIYHFINFAALLLMSFAWIFIPQHLNIAFIPLITVLLIRSGYCLIRKKYISDE